jgi:hypothetical protein
MCVCVYTHVCVFVYMHVVCMRACAVVSVCARGCVCTCVYVRVVDVCLGMCAWYACACVDVCVHTHPNAYQVNNGRFGVCLFNFELLVIQRILYIVKSPNCTHTS